MNRHEHIGRNGIARRGAGMTMIELIVVLAILALMSAVAIPTFARLGYFSRNDTQATARELLSMLKAAKIYSATYRVNTAIAYSLATAESIDAAGLVYKLPRAIADHTYTGGVRVSGDIYVPVSTDESGAFFRKTQSDTAILPDGPNGDNLRDSLTAIRIYRVDNANTTETDGEPQFAASAILPLRDFGNVEHGFPSHIFTPGGKILVPNTTVPERFKMYVGYGPEASDTERYVDQTTKELRVETIELSQNTGRIQLGQE